MVKILYAATLKKTRQNTDPRIERILEHILRLSTLDFSFRGEISDKGDELDAIITGLNTLTEELQASGKNIRDFEQRINSLLDIMLNYTMMDFSRKAVISENGDEMDALAVGLNTMAEELVANMEKEQNYLKRIKESEERFRMVVEGVKDYAIYMIDSKGYVLNWNEGAERIKGYTREEIIGKHFSMFYTMDEIKEGEPEFNLKKAKELGRYETENWRVKKDGSRFWADVVFTALYDEMGKLKGFSKITRDATERKLSEERLKESEDRNR